MPVGDRDGSGDSLGSVEDLASPVRIHSLRAPPGKASCKDLNSAINAGDWSAVGTTAALLTNYAAPERSASGSLSGFLSSEARSARSTAFSMSNNSVGRVQELKRMVIGED